MTDTHDPMWRRWAEVDRLFEQALERPAAERRAFVVEACGSDMDLRDAVLELIDASESAEGILGPSTGMLRAVFDRQGSDRGGRARLGAGQIVGRFRVISELGRGGMATVYEAERTDGGFAQRVAVKVLDRGTDTDDVVSRFLAERQILSDLVHPNIARLLDGGSTEDGHPYFVMEKVDGEPITEWADSRGLTIGERLDLFRQVAEAVGYAHARLIVHRDLKPANVLVGDDGRVRLLDFGIAKLLGPDGTGDGSDGPATRWMTPQYASPEQILGLPVTTASDVHGLGVILYELLTGHRPFGDDGSTDFEMQKAICEEMPERPSGVVTRTVERRQSDRPDIRPSDVSRARGTDPSTLKRELDGDLDAIVLKALRKEPEARYGTVQALVDDVDRYRTGFPVHAHAGAWSYTAKKFIRRNWLGVAGVAAVVTILAGASVLLSIQQAETVRERDRATREATNSRLVIDFLADVFRGRNPNEAPPDTITARELLAWGLERVDSEFVDRPDVQAELLTVMGGAHFNLGLMDEAVALHERSVALRRQVYGDSAAEVADGLGLLATALSQNRDFQLEVPVREEIVAIRRRTAGPSAASTANALRQLGVANRELGRLDLAEQQLREALAIRERSGSADENDEVTDMLALAYVLRGMDRLDEAEALYEEAIPRYRELHGPMDTDLANYYNNLGYLHLVREDYAGAEPLYRQALEVSSAAFGRGHPNSTLLANNLAGVMHYIGDHEEEQAVLKRTVDAALEQWPDGHWRVANAWSSYGVSLLRDGRVTDSQAPLEAAVQEYLRTLGVDHYWTGFANADLAVCLILQGDPRGQPYLDGFYDRLKSYVDANDGLIERGTALQLEPFVRVLRETGLTEEAERFGVMLPREAQ